MKFASLATCMALSLCVSAAFAGDGNSVQATDTSAAADAFKANPGDVITRENGKQFQVLVGDQFVNADMTQVNATSIALVTPDGEQGALQTDGQQISENDCGNANGCLDKVWYRDGWHRHWRGGWHEWHRFGWGHRWYFPHRHYWHGGWHYRYWHRW